MACFFVHINSRFFQLRIEWLNNFYTSNGEVIRSFQSYKTKFIKYDSDGILLKTLERWQRFAVANQNHTTGLKELLNRLQNKVEIFTTDAPTYFWKVSKYYKYKIYLENKNNTVSKNHCEFKYNGVDLLVGKKTIDGRKMLMVLGNEMHEVGTLRDNYLSSSLLDDCPPVEETVYSCFIKYEGFAKTCFNTEARDYLTAYWYSLFSILSN